MKTTPALILCLAALKLASTQARAETPANEFPRRTISFEELVARCEDPRSFIETLSPSGIVIRCEAQQKGWKPHDFEGPITFAEDRINFSVTDIRFRVNPISKMSFHLQMCKLNDIEVSRRAKIEKSSDCRGMIAIKNDPLGYCQAALRKLSPTHWEENRETEPKSCKSPTP